MKVEFHAVFQSSPAPHPHSHKFTPGSCQIPPQSAALCLLFIPFPSPYFLQLVRKFKPPTFRSRAHFPNLQTSGATCTICFLFNRVVKVGLWWKGVRDKRFEWKHSASLIISGGMIRPLVSICLPGFEVMSLLLYVAQFAKRHTCTHKWRQSTRKHTH